MQVHLCDFCDGRIERPAAVLTIFPPATMGESEQSIAVQAMQQLMGAPVKHLELCAECLRALIGVKRHVDAVRPQRPSATRGVAGDVVQLFGQMFKDPSP